jgi:histidinol-phosphate aminotransferase
LRKLGFIVPDSATNFVLAQGNARAIQDIFEQLKQRDIYVRYFRLPGLEDKLRITIGTPQQNDALLTAMTEIMDAH